MHAYLHQHLVLTPVLYFFCQKDVGINTEEALYNSRNEVKKDRTSQVDKANDVTELKDSVKYDIAVTVGKEIHGDGSDTSQKEIAAVSSDDIQVDFIASKNITVQEDSTDLPQEDGGIYATMCQDGGNSKTEDGSQLPSHQDGGELPKAQDGGELPRTHEGGALVEFHPLVPLVSQQAR